MIALTLYEHCPKLLDHTQRLMGVMVLDPISGVCLKLQCGLLTALPITCFNELGENTWGSKFWAMNHPFNKF